MPALGTRLLTFTIDSIDSTAQVSNVQIVPEEADSDFTSFADAAQGGAIDWHLTGIATQDVTTGSLWDKIWTAAGTTVPVVIRPAGGTVASATQPHFTGNVLIKVPTGNAILGGDANTSATAKFTFEFDFTFTAKPTRVTA